MYIAVLSVITAILHAMSKPAKISIHTRGILRKLTFRNLQNLFWPPSKKHKNYFCVDFLKAW